MCTAVRDGGQVTTNLTFISPDGLKFFSRQAVDNYIKKHNGGSNVFNPTPAAVSSHGQGPKISPSEKAKISLSKLRKNNEVGGVLNKLNRNDLIH